MLIHEEDENGQAYIPEDPSYVLNGYVKRGNLLEEFYGFTFPRTKQKLSEYYNKLLAIQYIFYLEYKSRMNEHTAMNYSNLKEPLIFALAKTQYAIIKSQNKYLGSNPR